MRLLVSEKSVQTAVREISPHQRHVKKDMRGRGVCQLRGGQEKQHKVMIRVHSDGHAAVSGLFYKQPRGAACALGRHLQSSGPSSAGRETWGSRKSPVPPGDLLQAGETQKRWE